jgi:hypothetical protein
MKLLLATGLTNNMKPTLDTCFVCYTNLTRHEGFHSYYKRMGITIDVVGGGSTFQGPGYLVHKWWCFRGWLEWFYMISHPKYLR